MLNLDSKNIRFLARMGSRGVLGQAVYDYACDGNDVLATTADLARASGFARFAEKFPDMLVNVGIAEQNLIGISAGLAYAGKPVVATTWAMFATARAADQVRNFMGYMQKNIKLVGMDSGLAISRFGYSHSNPADIAIMRAIPGITVLSPCDGLEIYKTIEAALKHDGPVYIRLTGSDTALLPMIYKEDIDFRIGKANVVREGSDVAIIACGNVVKNAVDAALELEEAGISVKVVDMHTIEPLDKEALDAMANYDLIATVENHLLHGGLGSAVAEYYSDLSIRPRHIMFGIDNCFPAPGSMRYAEEQAGLASEQISARILRELNSSKEAAGDH